MATDKLINHSQGESIITNLGTIATNLQNVTAISPAKFGMGYAVCDTAAGTAAKTANIANYVLTEGALVTVKFTNANTASNATLNLNNTGAKPILYKGSALTTDIISAGDICTFIYSTANSGSYNIINVDALSGAGAGTVKSVGAEGGIITDQTSGAAISTTGNVKLNLKSDTAFTATAPDPIEIENKIYPVALDAAGHPAVSVPGSTYTGATGSAISVDNTNNTIDVAAGTTSVAGVVQLEDSYSSTSATTAATPNAVKAAYDLADGKYTKPQTGIPATDLATAVQTSLTAADNAVPNTRTINGTALSSDITLSAADVGAIATTAKGAASGVAELDANGKVPSSQLPSYVDDVLEYPAKASFPTTGESGKIYVDTTTNKTYRWSGSAYVEISESLALGETSSTAYRGDRGKTAYDHSQITSGNPHNVTKSDVGLGNVGNFKAVSTVASQGLSDTEKSNARANIGAGTGNGTYSKPSGGIPKTDLEQSVQNSLGKADTALQSFSESDPTVPSWAKASTKPSYTQDEVGDGTTYKRVSATEKTAWNNKGTYSKPSGGIPKTDLSSAVQTSLGLADTALQSETDPTVPAWAKAASKPSYTASEVGLGNVGNFKAVSTVASQGLSNTEKANARANIGAGTGNGTYSKPSTGIPKSDLASAVQTSLGKADSALQSETDPTVPSWAKASSKPSYTASEVGAVPNTHPFFTIPINHNMVYRGQNLGATLTNGQHTALSSGNFTDLYLGDYWTKTVTIPAGTYTGGDGKEDTVPAQTNITLKAVIADFDTFYGGYASSYAAINTHHAAVIVTGFSNVVWNCSDSTYGGYRKSLIHTWLVGSVLPQIETWFGSAKVLSHQKLLTNAITGDAASGWAWSSQKISLLSENQMYGSKVWGNSKASNGGYEPGEAFKHLNVFNHIDTNLLFGNKNIWLRDISSAVRAAGLGSDGVVHDDDASASWFAPAALILLS